MYPMGVQEGSVATPSPLLSVSIDRLDAVLMSSLFQKSTEAPSTFSSVWKSDTVPETAMSEVQPAPAVWVFHATPS